MQIINRLVWKEWLKSFIGATVALFILISVAQLISGLLRTSVTPKEVLLNYTLSLPSILAKVIPLSCLLGTLFSLNSLKNKSELIAIFAAGFSRKKFVMLIVQISLVVASLQALNVFYLDPISKKVHKKIIVDGERKFKQTKSKGLLSSVITSGKFWYRSENYYLSYSVFDKITNRLKQVTLYFFNEQNQNTKIIRAQSAKGDEFGNWIFENVQEVDGIDSGDFPTFRDIDQLKLSLNMIISDFNKIESDLNTLYPFALMDFILQIRDSGISAVEYEIFFLDKLVSALICPLFALFPIGIMFSPNRRTSSFGKNVGFTIVFTILYWLFYSSALALGNTGKIPTLVATFTIPIIFIIYFAYLFSKNKKLA